MALTLVEVVYNDGGTKTYTLFLGISADATAEALLQTEPASVLAHVRSPQGDGLLHEALSTSVAGVLLLSLLQERRHVATSVGELGAFAAEARHEARGSVEGTLPVRRVQTAQSNSSLIYGNRLILKLLCRGWNQGATPSWKWVLSVGNGIFSLLARLSHDSNIFRMFATDGPGIHDVSFVLVHALSCEAASRTAGRMAAAMTASTPCDRAA